MRRIRALAVLACVLGASLSYAQYPAPPEPPPLPKVEFPKYETRVLPNGLTVYAIQHSEQPVVSIRLLIAAGASSDPVKMPGLAAFTAGLLNQGTETRNANQISEAVDRLGASLEASADMESTTISGSALKENTTTILELMTDILLHPKFSDAEIARRKQREMSSLEADMEEPEYIANAVFERVLYGSHPYAHPVEGTLQSIPAIQRDDLVRFHQTYYAPNISALAIVGDLPTDEAFHLAERYFGAWKKRDVPKPALAAPPKPTQRRIVIVDMPETVQTEVRVGQLSVARNDPDYFRLLVTNYVLGASSSGRLHRKLREERGLTYGAYATIEPRTGPGVFYAITDTRTEKTAEALGLIVDEFKRLQTTEPTAGELKDTKTFLIGSFPLSIELPSNLTNRLMSVFLYNLGPDYLKTYRDRIAAVSADDVERVSREKLSPETLTIVLAGKAEAFKKDLERLGKVEVIPLEKLDLGSPTLMR
ncbi:MAG TPA: pitrilysin family protein [Terriglobia bacterium]|nr:pitrilysin family protein [Terriglobia bacterium]